MIIDLILDRKDGKEYDANEFYKRVAQFAKDNKDMRIPNAMGRGTEKDTKKALCDYIIEYKYPVKLCNYIKSVKWL